jgi:hypothetical protein
MAHAESRAYTDALPPSPPRRQPARPDGDAPGGEDLVLQLSSVVATSGMFFKVRVGEGSQ